MSKFVQINGTTCVRASGIKLIKSIEFRESIIEMENGSCFTSEYALSYLLDSVNKALSPNSEQK